MKTILLTAFISLNFILYAAGDCSKPVKRGVFKSNMETIAAVEFAQTRLKLVDDFLSENCISVKQLKEVLLQFNFEAHKAEVAVKAYKTIVDRDNFHEIYREFSNESYVRDIQSQIK